MLRSSEACSSKASSTTDCLLGDALCEVFCGSMLLHMAEYVSVICCRPNGLRCVCIQQADLYVVYGLNWSECCSGSISLHLMLHSCMAPLFSCGDDTRCLSSDVKLLSCMTAGLCCLSAACQGVSSDIVCKHTMYECKPAVRLLV